MKRLLFHKTLRRLGIIGIWSLIVSITFVINYIGLFQSDKLDLVENLNSAEPSQIQRHLYYSLFAQKPPEGSVVEESVSLREGRALQLKSYLEWQGSPLAGEAETFVNVADKYGLNWLLLPSIAGKESTFGKQVPTGSNNPFGWGVYGSQAMQFASWAEGIETVGKGLARYAQNGLTTIEKIEPLYCPPSFNSHHAWRDGVNYFVWEIGSYPEFK